jgi:hypothetical protein
MIAGPDSRAQIAIQAAERLDAYGAGVPWEVCPPLPPLLIAWLGKIPGVTPEGAYVALVWIAFAGSATAVYSLWQRMGAAQALAVQAAVLALLAPSGILAIWERGEIDRLLFWKILPLVFVAIDIFRRKPGLVRLLLIPGSLALMALTRSERLIAFDLLALGEWIGLLALCRPWVAENGRTRLRRAVGAAMFVIVAGGRLTAMREPGALPSMPANLAVRAAQPVVGPVSLEARLEPALGEIHDLINGDVRPRESVLWLQALGARSVIAPKHGKFARELECVAEEQGWCVFDVGGPAPPAVLVSRERFETLKPVRGLFDVEGLERYLLWAMRPEAVGFERVAETFEVRARPGPDDLVLVRVRARGWEDHRKSFSVRLKSDPIGYSVLDLADDRREVVPLRFLGAHLIQSGPPPEPIALDDADYPRILSEGVVEATAYAPPPFRPGANVSIFGERFEPEVAKALVDGAQCEITYASVGQINIRLPDDVAPGMHELVVRNADLPSYPYRFEVAGQ